MKRLRRFGVYCRNAEQHHLSCFTHGFELLPAASPPSLQNLVASQPLHGVMLHYSTLSHDHLALIAQFQAHSAGLPIVVLADQWDWDTVRHCSRLGIDAFLGCSEGAETKLATLAAVLRNGGLRRLLAEMGKPRTTWPLRMKQALELILEKFPRVLHAEEVSAALGIHRRTFEKEFHETFGLSYVSFMRVLLMYETWHLQQHTHMSISRIATFLGYSAETHLARDCQKVFELSPKHLRELSEKDFHMRLKKAFGS